MRLLKIYDTGGTEIVPDDTGLCALADATTYYAEFRCDLEDRSGYSVQWDYGAALVATITIEASNRSEDRAGVTSYGSTGWGTTSATAVSPAAGAGTTVAHYADYMAARSRAKIDVTTGGTLRGTEHSKARGSR